ncbi:hypothetical protein P7C71_g5904, partial [Lecanoromycetidae sp. Uapishka_2]
MHIPTLVLSTGLVPLAFAAYGIQDDYSGNNFLNMFTFDTEDDPTNGYVNYVDSSTAQEDNLTSVENGIVTIRSDSSSIASGRGRNSVRLTSKAQYTHGLVVLDLQHMPGSACGIWPAFWMTGPSWPNNGEIDIIEGVNYQSQNAMTMHSSSGCSMVSEDCEGSTGCGVQTGGPASFGDGFNAANGGVYAMEWTSEAINIWFFSRSSIPNGATGDAPDPSAWGNPTASFQGGSGCDIDQHFQNNNIVFDTTFCGDWAGSVWSQDATCSSKAATCQDYVMNNPEAFTEAYWTINSLKVYSQGAASTPTPTPTPTPAASTSPAPVTSVVNTPAPEPTTTAIVTPTPESTTIPVATLTPEPSTTPSSAAAAAPSSTSTAPQPEYTGDEGLIVGPNGQIEENPIKAREIEGGNMALGVDTEGRVAEHPVKARDVNTGNMALSVEPEGRVAEHPIKARDINIGNMALRVETEGQVAEHPVKARDVNAGNMALRVEAEGRVIERPVGARDNGSVEEGVVGERSFASVVGKRGKVGRHLRRHR